MHQVRVVKTQRLFTPLSAGSILIATVLSGLTGTAIRAIREDSVSLNSRREVPLAVSRNLLFYGPITIFSIFSVPLATVRPATGVMPLILKKLQS